MRTFCLNWPLIMPSLTYWVISTFLSDICINMQWITTVLWPTLHRLLWSHAPRSQLRSTQRTSRCEFVRTGPRKRDLVILLMEPQSTFHNISQPRTWKNKFKRNSQTKSLLPASQMWRAAVHDGSILLNVSYTYIVYLLLNDKTIWKCNQQMVIK